MGGEAIVNRYLVLRVPNTGPRALISAPNGFPSEAEAQERIDSIEAQQLQVHHTYLEIWPYVGDKFAALKAEGILF